MSGLKVSKLSLGRRSSGTYSVDIYKCDLSLLEEQRAEKILKLLFMLQASSRVSQQLIASQAKTK